ncbi:hypothetical protein BU14_0352s0009 [Porphyra umbilicalis]|uniref:Uncharacterized protein n=1 Tax=Porphyra umbilicalis TaxID=2786 RepID=A0A1X6NXX4_PORUM|nr:hypothetical protein BU14_0352s0009 [Porphyra umbilicalis]|eukprot:OSX73390.1 hypothetical protein BU14_0352s0009 [Porphyra umbilicalis]
MVDLHSSEGQLMQRTYTMFLPYATINGITIGAITTQPVKPCEQERVGAAPTIVDLVDGPQCAARFLLHEATGTLVSLGVERNGRNLIGYSIHGRERGGAATATLPRRTVLQMDLPPAVEGERGPPAAGPDLTVRRQLSITSGVGWGLPASLAVEASPPLAPTLPTSPIDFDGFVDQMARLFGEVALRGRPSRQGGAAAAAATPWSGSPRPTGWVPQPPGSHWWERLPATPPTGIDEATSSFCPLPLAAVRRLQVGFVQATCNSAGVQRPVGHLAPPTPPDGDAGGVSDGGGGRPWGRPAPARAPSRRLPPGGRRVGSPASVCDVHAPSSGGSGSGSGSGRSDPPPRWAPSALPPPQPLPRARSRRSGATPEEVATARRARRERNRQSAARANEVRRQRRLAAKATAAAGVGGMPGGGGGGVPPATATLARGWAAGSAAAGAAAGPRRGGAVGRAAPAAPAVDLDGWQASDRPRPWAAARLPRIEATAAPRGRTAAGARAPTRRAISAGAPPPPDKNPPSSRRHDMPPHGSVPPRGAATRVVGSGRRPLPQPTVPPADVRVGGRRRPLVRAGRGGGGRAAGAPRLADGVHTRRGSPWLPTRPWLPVAPRGARGAGGRGG